MGRGKIYTICTAHGVVYVYNKYTNAIHNIVQLHLIVMFEIEFK